MLHSFSLFISVSVASDLCQLQTTKPCVWSAGCWAVNPHWRGWVQTRNLTLSNFPRARWPVCMYIGHEKVPKAYLVYTPHAHCLFCAPGTETRLWHSFLAVIFQTHDCKPNWNWRCNSAMDCISSPLLPFFAHLRQTARAGQEQGGLGPRGTEPAAG